MEQNTQMSAEYAEYKKMQQQGNRQEVTSAKNIKKIRKENAEMGSTLRQALEDSKGLTRKITLFNANAHGVKNNEDTTNRFMIMENILSAYAGDEVAINELNELKDMDSPKRMSQAVRECLEGEMSLELLEQSLFAELHGINYTDLIDIQFSDEQLVNLSIIKEICPTAEMKDFVNCTTSQLGVITKAAVQNKDLSDINLLTELCVLGNIEEVRKSKTISAQQIKIGNILNAKTVVYDYNDSNDNIEIYEQTPRKEQLLAIIDENDRFVKGDINIVKQITAQSRNIQELNVRGGSELSHTIDKYRTQTTKEAKENPMSEFERQMYDKEVKEAEELHEKRKQSFFDPVG